MSETDPFAPRVAWTPAVRKLLRPRRGAALSKVADDRSPRAAVEHATARGLREGEAFGFSEETNPWERVRAAVAAASDADYADARAVAAKLREGTPLHVRGMIAYAFPSEPAWA